MNKQIWQEDTDHKHQEFVRTIWECSIWAKVLFADLSSSLGTWGISSRHGSDENCAVNGEDLVRHCRFLATCSSNKEFLLLYFCTWPSVVQAISPEYQFVQVYTSTKGDFLPFIPLAWNNSMINQSLVWSMFFLSWLVKRHYLILYWLVTLTPQ